MVKIFRLDQYVLRRCHKGLARGRQGYALCVMPHEALNAKNVF
jgi:hypothetical protein